jgi:predicted NUDIX family phosphoesterase
MTQPPSESVLCVPTACLPAAWLPEAGSLSLSLGDFLAGLAGSAPVWRPRQAAETDPLHQQLIPYLLLRNRQGELAAYPRQGSEKRLHGLWSLGLGGHVNPVDAPPVPDAEPARFWESTLLRGLHRELAEELPAAAGGDTAFLGLIHESLSAVGRVHLGLVFLHSVAGRPLPSGDELAGLRWLPAGQAGAGEWPFSRFELWSQLALQLLNQTTLP